MKTKGEADKVAACLWPVSDELVVALDGRFGEVTDAYVNGSQVWLRDDGPGGVALEWRLHPVGGYSRPGGVGIYDVFPTVALAVSSDETPPAPAADLWDGLEAFAAYGDPVAVDDLKACCVQSIGLEVGWSGLVDHQSVGDEWQRSGRKSSIFDALVAQLS